MPAEFADIVGYLSFANTRFAPTPSGYLHLGNILSFGITAALAKKHGAKIMLRIDDLDKTRANPLYVQDIFDTLNFLGITWDEGPRSADEFENDWSQLQRMDSYNTAIEQLKSDGYLFACTCSRTSYTPQTCNCLNKKLPFDTPAANWRIKTNKCPVAIREYSGQTVSTDTPDDLQNFIIRKKDGYPSYQLASVVDDLHYGTDLIIRGDDLWHSTIAQHFLAYLLKKPQFAGITFYHHPLIKSVSGEKLSKSAGATSVKYLRENGRLPDQIFFMILQQLSLSGQANNWQEFIHMLDDIYHKPI